MARLRRFAEWLPLVDPADVDKSMDWFHRHGPIAILLGRLVPGIRSLISIPAGVDRMSGWSFTLYTTIGSLVWNTALVTAGFLLGDNWPAVTEWMDTFSTVVYVILIALVAGLTAWLVRRAARRSRARRDKAPARRAIAPTEDSERVE